MASPVVAGVAALILSYYPELTGQQVKQILETSVQRIPGKAVDRPGSESEKVELSQLCKTAGIVNAYEALKLAAATKGQRK